MLSSFDSVILQPDPNNVPHCAVVDTQLICKVQIIFTSLKRVRKTLVISLWYTITRTATCRSTSNTTKHKTVSCIKDNVFIVILNAHFSIKNEKCYNYQKFSVIEYRTSQMKDHKVVTETAHKYTNW